MANNNNRYSGLTANYWADRREQEDVIRHQAAAQTLQPRDGSVLIVSVENRVLGTSAGRISEASIETAAKAVIEQTHKLASDEEIAAYRLDQKNKKSNSAAFTAAQLKSIDLAAGGKK